MAHATTDAHPTSSHPGIATTYGHGWYQVAYESEVSAELVPVRVGSRRIILVRQNGALRAFEANCPHRGAHLGLGGRVEGNSIVCPFHGYRIQLGCHANTEYSVREYPLFALHGLIFLRLSDSHDGAFPESLTALSEGHRFIQTLQLSIRAPIDLIIENALDRRHFDVVHGVNTASFAVREELSGTLTAKSTLAVPALPRDREHLLTAKEEIDYDATVFSPGVVVVRLGGRSPYSILTAATDEDGCGTCTMRLTLIVPDTADDDLIETLRKRTVGGVVKDRTIWENLQPQSMPRYQIDDEPVVAFQRYCERFRLA
jgi:3-ketosteroid 9alpha-monooxygenase subunit A